MRRKGFSELSGAFYPHPLTPVKGGASTSWGGGVGASWAETNRLIAEGRDSASDQAPSLGGPSRVPLKGQTPNFLWNPKEAERLPPFAPSLCADGESETPKSTAGLRPEARRGLSSPLPGM